MRTFSVGCDAGRRATPQCLGWVGVEASSAAARKIARQQGWKRVLGQGRYDSRDYCPECAPRFMPGATR